MRPESDLIVQFIPLMLFSLGFAIVAYKLAKEKGRNALLWTIHGAIPVLNFICMGFFVGAANLRLERKLDDILSKK